MLYGATAERRFCADKHHVSSHFINLQDWLYTLIFTHTVSSELYRFLWPSIRAGHSVFVLWFLYFFFFFFVFLAYSQRSEIGCLPYFHTWCGLSANLEYMSEMCCTRIAKNTGRKNYAKNRRLRTIAQICRARSSPLRHVSTTGKNC